MTKDETIDMIILDYKNGNQSAMSDHCNGTRCDECQFEFNNCVNEVANALIERLIKAEEHQETNLEHYVEYYNNYDQCLYMDTVKLMNEAHRRLNNFEEAIEWLLEPYKPPKSKYKLTQFEYDFLECLKGQKTDLRIYYIFKSMREKGYFKSVPKDMPIAEILSKAEVIDE